MYDTNKCMIPWSVSKSSFEVFDFIFLSSTALDIAGLAAETTAYTRLQVHYHDGAVPQMQSSCFAEMPDVQPHLPTTSRVKAV
jgi:hypothetical protein